MFDDNKITLDKYHFDSRYKSTFMMRFGGEAFIHEDRPLDFYSDGLNSFMYIKLLASLIPKISDISCKSPTVLLDEPEIGLHQERISELIYVISINFKKNSLLLINTHSPKVVEGLVQQKCDFDIYRVSQRALHTVCNKLNKKWLFENNHLITILETSCYFSDYLVFVEGDSELQIFHNQYLLDLFPFLKRVHFYAFNSNNQILRFVDPSIINLGIPYLLIVDMDKII